MEVNKVITLLEENNYKYNLKNEVITVHLDFSQNVIIDLSDAQKIIISDQLTGWNFLTGYIKMSLKNAVLYNFILLLFAGFLSHYVILIGQNMISLLILLIGWVLMFTTYYLIKLESFKLQFFTLKNKSV